MKHFSISLCVILNFSSLFAARIEEFQVPSGSMGKSIPVSVVIPESLPGQVGGEVVKRPVVYMLHGAGDNDQKWPPYLVQLADRYQMFFVCPDGAGTSWWLDSPVDPAMRYETFVSSELVKWTDGKFGTIVNRNGRGIAGQSMGGHGAMFIAIRHQNVFGAVVSMSGGVDLRPFPTQWDIAKRLGPLESNRKVWDEHSVVVLAENVKDGEFAISIDCGVDDFFIQVNRDLHQILLKNKVRHDYSERPGGHGWDYWSNCIPYQALFLHRFFTHPEKQGR
jgi:S-formylglutathione hydrolase FrmB